MGDLGRCAPLRFLSASQSHFNSRKTPRAGNQLARFLFHPAGVGVRNNSAPPFSEAVPFRSVGAGPACDHLSGFSWDCLAAFRFATGPDGGAGRRLDCDNRGNFDLFDLPIYASQKKPAHGLTTALLVRFFRWQ